MLSIHRINFCIVILATAILLAPFMNTNLKANASNLVEPEEALLRDAEIYALNMQITLDESMNRFKIQEIAGHLEAELYEKEIKTFAGLWIEHTPEFRLVVQFTQDGDQTIKPYIHEELTNIIVVNTAKVSLAILEETQKEISAQVQAVGIEVESQVNVFENRVELFVTDWPKLEEAIQRGEVQLPANVFVIVIEEMGKPNSDIYGGLPLSWCTSGFSVRQTRDPYLSGITTAGQCPNDLSYNGQNLIFMTQLYAGSYDIQWLHMWSH
jgi:hypothetical protein